MPDSTPPADRPAPPVPVAAEEGTAPPGSGQPPRNGLPADASVRVRYKRAALVKVLIVDTDFVLVIADGRKILIKDGASRATLDNDYTIGFSDEEVPARSLFAQAETAEASTDAVPLGSTSEGMSSPRLEPSESDVALAPAATTLTVKAAASGLGSLGAVGGVVAAVTCPPPAVPT